jgi:polyhydroxyalkanoic acid synthase PhaR subunit
MAQPQTDGMMQMLDPFGFWKTSRDATLESLSKLMIDMVNSDEYARSTGMIMDQYLAMSQPLQDAVQKAMTSSLAYLNMPTRAEVISLAEQLVNIETRLDDLDAKTSDMREDSRTESRTIASRMNKVEDRIATSEEAVAKEIRSVDRSLDKVLSTIMARLDGLEAAVLPAREARRTEIATAAAKPEPKAEAKVEAKPEPKPVPKAEAKPEPKVEAKK